MKMSVAQKMLVLAAVVLIGIISLIGFTTYEVNKVYNHANYVNTNVTPNLTLLGKIQFKFNTLRIRLANHVMVEDPQRMVEIETAIRNLQSELKTYTDEYTHLVADASDRKMLEDDIKGLQAYYDEMEPILRASNGMNKKLATQLYIAIRKTAEHSNEFLTTHVDSKRQLGDRVTNEAASTRDASNTSAIVMGLMVLSVVGGMLYWITRQLFQQLGGEPLQAVQIANAIAHGDLNQSIQIEGKDEESLIAAMYRMQLALKLVIEEQIRVAESNKLGDIDACIDVNKFEGSYKTMGENINFMAANQALVMRKVVACVDQFSRGNFDAPLDPFPGKRAFINEGIERLRGNIKNFIHEMQSMSAQHDAGNIDVKINSQPFEGAYLEMAEGVNRMVFEHIAGNQKAMDVVKAFGNGNLQMPLERFPGKKAYINDAIEQVRQNLNAFISSMNDMSQKQDAGDIDAMMDAAQFQGAYRQMAEGVNAMVAGHVELNRKAIGVVKAFGDGEFDRVLTKFPGKKAYINDAIEQVRVNLKALSSDAAQLAEAARNGEVTVRADAARHKGDFRKIIEGVNQTLDMIVEPIKVVKEASEALYLAINEIAAGNQNLSQRTEEQAFTLTQTASNMSTMAQNVKENAENAMQANHLAMTASEYAMRSGEVVNQVVVTMNAINESALKIEDIISVIDAIAFQTNILALNAAVEAARAGEQGRGFAVVAGEVRSLAQRSAAAAKEIKELITDSVNKTGEGSRLVENAGQSMQELVDSVKRVSEIISEISVSSTEQTTGIDSVNQAINQMDEATQQNAALVEQAAAAAGSMVEQANQLSSVISQFKLGHKESAQSNLRTGTHG